METENADQTIGGVDMHHRCPAGNVSGAFGWRQTEVQRLPPPATESDDKPFGAVNASHRQQTATVSGDLIRRENPNVPGNTAGGHHLSSRQTKHAEINGGRVRTIPNRLVHEIQEHSSVSGATQGAG